MKFGALPEEPSAKLLQFNNYLPKLPVLPKDLPNWSLRMPTAFAPWGSQGNSTVGNCTIAMLAHTLQMLTAANGSLIQPTETGTVQSYVEAAGYVRGNPATDHGYTTQGALSYFRKKGLITSCNIKTVTNADGTKTTTYTPYARQFLRGYVQIDHKNVEAVRFGYYGFGTVMLATTCPKKVKNANGTLVSLSSSYWDAAAADGGPDGAHAICLSWVNAIGPVIITWGRLVQLTWAFWDKYVYIAYVPLATYWANQDLIAPSGFDMAALDADLLAIQKG